MAESDEDSERSRSRDKFRRERSDYGDKARRNDHRERKTWREDSGDSRRRTREEYEDDRERRRYSPHRGREWGSPPLKRRRDGWEGMADFPGMMPPYGMMAPRPPWIHPEMPPGPHPMGPPGVFDHHGGMLGGIKQMMSFKQFLGTQDDSINDQEAIQKYNEYKIEFRRKQISEFFEVHKEESWFIYKYHPTSIKRHEEENAANLKKRLAAFKFLLDSGRLTVPLSVDYSDAIMKVMDAAVIKMEGGMESDLMVLETVPSSESKPVMAPTEASSKPQLEVSNNKPGEEVKEEGTLTGSAGGGRSSKKRHKNREHYVSSEEENDDGSSAESDPSGHEQDGHPAGGGGQETDQVSQDVSESHAVPETGQTEETAGTIAMETEGHQGSEAAVESAQEPVQSGGQPLAVGQATSSPLHITHSIYIKNIHPKVSAEDIIDVCKKLPGFLRVAFADPTPEKGYVRRGWVTFSSQTNIKDVCLKLGATKVKEQLLNCMVNRELSRRVKTSQCVVWSRSVVNSDLQLALDLFKKLDEKHKLWEHASALIPPLTEAATTRPMEDAADSAEVQPNPLISMATALLGNKEELAASSTMGASGVEDEEGAIADSNTELLDNTDEKMKVLDWLLWYLRVVHSFDFYSATFFPNEDCMPHRCGIVTAKGPRPSTVKQEEVNEYLQNFQNKVKPLMQNKEELSEEEMEKFGKKDPEAEIERFIVVNTEQLGESKYLCPLSGKKFKGAEFVRKHIFNKHNDKVEDVRLETEFFNNYLKDPNRPMPYETSLLSPLASGSDDRLPASGLGMRRGPPWPQSSQMMGLPRGGWNPEVGTFPIGPSRRGQFRPPRGGGGARGRQRKLIQYNDLDAPGEDY